MKKTKAIIIGGPIAAGKSSLVGSLPFKSIQELDTNDELQRILLEEMYKGDDIAKQVFQLDMLLTRFDKYKELAASNETVVFDRSILEDWIFANKLFGNQATIWNYYNSIWEDKVNEMITEVGKPGIYILLDISWESFQDRLFKRGRSSEIENYNENEQYFKELLNSYKEKMIEMFNRFNIEYVVINTDNKDKLEVIDEANDILRERGIL